MSRQDRWSWFSAQQRRFKSSTPRLALVSRPRRTLGCGYTQSRRLHVEPLEDRRLLAVFSVSNLDNTGAGSLREAIGLANSAAGPDEITFAVTGTINLNGQLPAIFDPLTITGPGQTLLTIDAGNGSDNNFGTGDGFRIFVVNDFATFNKIDVTLSGLTLTGGDTINGVDDSNVNSSGLDGGAILSNENLTIIDSTITGNSTGSGGLGEYDSYGGGNGGSGGGIASFAGSLTIIGSTISGNTTGNGGDGGGGYTDGGIGGSGGNGGGIFTQDNTTTVITGSTISGNTTGNAGNGGDVYGYSGPYGGVYPGDGGNGGRGGGISSRGDLTVTGSTISGNTTGIGGNPGYGDNPANPGYGGNGGGIDDQSPSVGSGGLTMTGSTISGNTSSSLGGGVFNGSVSSISSSTITDNTADFGGGIANSATITLESTIIAKNTAIVSGPDVNSTVFGSSNVLGTFNLIGDDTALAGLADGVDGNQIGTSGSPIDPLLGVLTNNGGPSETHALLTGSPAINLGSSSESFDQRGTSFLRDDGNGVDVGAFESQGAPSIDSADFDGDNDIDGADFLAWQRGFGTPSADKPNGDADNDNDVDAIDLAIWETQFGQPVPVVAATAPQAAEPVAASNLIDAVMAIVLVRDAQVAETPEFDDEPAFSETFSDNAFAAEAIVPTSITNESEPLESGSSEITATEAPWLTDDLLERVFG